LEDADSHDSRGRIRDRPKRRAYGSIYDTLIHTMILSCPMAAAKEEIIFLE